MRLSRAVARIADGVDKSGANQVRTYRDIMHQFVIIEGDKAELRLKELHDPDQPADDMTAHSNRSEHVGRTDHELVVQSAAQASQLG